MLHHEEKSLCMVNITMNFKVMGINIIFQYQVVVTFDVAASIFHTKIINTVAFNQVAKYGTVAMYIVVVDCDSSLYIYIYSN